MITASNWCIWFVWLLRNVTDDRQTQLLCYTVRVVCCSCWSIATENQRKLDNKKLTLPCQHIVATPNCKSKWYACGGHRSGGVANFPIELSLLNKTGTDGQHKFKSNLKALQCPSNNQPARSLLCGRLPLMFSAQHSREEAFFFHSRCGSRLLSCARHIALIQM